MNRPKFNLKLSSMDFFLALDCLKSLSLPSSGSLQNSVPASKKPGPAHDPELLPSSMVKLPENLEISASCTPFRLGIAENEQHLKLKQWKVLALSAEEISFSMKVLKSPASNKLVITASTKGSLPWPPPSLLLPPFLFCSTPLPSLLFPSSLRLHTPSLSKLFDSHHLFLELGAELKRTRVQIEALKFALEMPIFNPESPISFKILIGSPHLSLDYFQTNEQLRSDQTPRKFGFHLDFDFKCSASNFLFL